MRRDTNKKWYSKNYNIGYCYERYGIVYTRIKNKRRTTILTWRNDSETKDKALKILDERMKEFLFPEIKRQEVQNPTLTVHDVIKRYNEIKGNQFTKDVKQLYNRSFKYYFTENIKMNYDDIFNHIVLMNNKNIIALTTRIKYLQYLQTFFDFCVKQQYIKENPIKVIGIPKKPKKTEQQIIEPEDMDTILKHLRSNEKLVEYAILFEFLYLTAIRIGESLKLTYNESINEEYIKIFGKGSIWRQFPLKPFPRIKELIEESKKYSKNGKLFRWNFNNKPELIFKKALKDLNLNPKATVHTLRASAEYRWVNVVGISYDIIVELSGHSFAMIEKHYRRKPNAKELTDLIEKKLKAA